MAQQMRLRTFGRVLYAVGGRYALTGFVFITLPVFWLDDGVSMGTRMWLSDLRAFWSYQPPQPGPEEVGRG